MEIKTPDQKLRVFISSTIDELAEERRLARDVINKLRLTPVFFELGARPHPPRDLYRAYLEQSHIFIGIYWNSYGWIGPDMEISGIEDEFDLSEGKPKLIYLKEPAPERQPRLSQLLSKIKKSDSVCYQKFCTAEDLAELLVNDIAVLLSERFEANGLKKDQTEKISGANLPIIRGRIIGRENELKLLKDLLSMPEAGLITITGPGGTGKTTLSLRLLHDIKDNYKNGVYFITLASITDASLIPSTIAKELGVFDTGRQPISNTLLEYLHDKKTVLLLDNFEQLADTALFVCKILENCPSVKIIVTSRTPLHLRGEHIFSLHPLPNPGNQVPDSELTDYPAIQLFIERAKEINSNVTLDANSLQSISAICKKLDGLPLAIELAAARTRYYPPVLLLGKMKKMLDELSHGSKDLPERQQTLRATIGWSVNLLDEPQQRFFRRLSVFSDSWTQEASEVIVNWDQSGINTQEITEKLVDLGLVESYSQKINDKELEIRFRMLQTVKEYASEILNSAGESEEVKRLHTNYFIGKANELEPLSWAVDTAHADNWFYKEYENLRLAFSFSMDKGNLNSCWQIFGALTWFWFRQGKYGEAFDWMKLVSISIHKEEDIAFKERISSKDRSRAYLTVGILRYFAGNYRDAEEYLELSAKISGETGNLKELARSKAFLGMTKLSLGDIAKPYLAEAIKLGHETQDVWCILFASVFMSEAFMAVGQYEKAAALLDESERNAIEFQSTFGSAIVSLQKGNLNYNEDHFSVAVNHFLKSIKLFSDLGMNTMNGWSFIKSGGCFTEAGEFSEARKYLEEGLEISRERGEKTMTMVVMLYFVKLYLAIRHKAKAIRIFSAIEILKNRGDMQGNLLSGWSTNAKIYGKVNEEIGGALDDPSFTNDVEAGKKLTYEQLIGLVTEKDNDEVLT